ncbi:MAG: histidine phosphatase family protein [Verrucomicrobia bacterium]|nr:histidine phosphatase family protein [Verrucomicrobiota bacterium]
MRARSYAYAIATLILAFELEAAGQQPAPSPTPVGTGVETIVCLRHGEKPPRGLGQLTCQGLNRALALPAVLLGKFGTPDYIFAPDPAVKVFDGTVTGYDYVRPLATIEPTAIRVGLPVDTDFGFLAINRLERELTRPRYNGKTIFVAWEHRMLDEMVKRLMIRFGGNGAEVPPWPADDYDSLYVLRIDRHNAANPISFTHDHEGLDGLSADCPESKRP